MKKLSEIIGNYSCRSISSDYITKFGDARDGVIEFVALTEDNHLAEVGYFYGDAKPKNIVDISTQVGCPSQCVFCAIGKRKFVRDLNPLEMYEQAVFMLQLARHFGVDIDAIPHKIDLAKTGEPLFNLHLITGIEKLAQFPVSFKLSTIFPDNSVARKNYEALAKFASNYKEPFQMQVSLISTSESFRQGCSKTKLLSFRDIVRAGELWHTLNPKGRKVNLSLILSQDNPCEVNDILGIFPPELFRFRFRPYVVTGNGKANNLNVLSQERLDKIKRQFEDEGYEVGDWAIPTATEQKFGLASNVTLERYLALIGRDNL